MPTTYSGTRPKKIGVFFSGAQLALSLATLFLSLALAQAPAFVPPVDLNKHSVPLSEVYFDTFGLTNPRALPLDQAGRQMEERLRDAIPPLHQPKYEQAAEATWLAEDDFVLGYAAGGEAWAYPLKIMNFHEIVNDTLAGDKVLISYCPLCFSGIVYSRELGDRTLTFGNTSALYESDMVMLDYETGSYWWQVAGRAIVGTLTDEQLTALPSTTTTWAGWRDLHPDSLVLSRDTGFDRPYHRDPFGSYADFVNAGQFAFPVGESANDPRLLPATKVLLVKLEDEARAYPLTVDSPAVMQDELAQTPVVVLTDPQSESGSVFLATVAEDTLTFRSENGAITDLETGSSWDMAGRATGGPLAGSQLTALPSKTSFWFAAIAAEPEATVFTPETAN